MPGCSLRTTFSFRLVRQMLVARINGIPAFGFAEATRRMAGSGPCAGLLEFCPSTADELRALMESDGPLTYTGPVSREGEWRAESFPIVIRPIVATGDALSVVAFQQCGITSALSYSSILEDAA